MRFGKNKHGDVSFLFHKWTARAYAKQTVCKVLNIFQHGKYLVAYDLKNFPNAPRMYQECKVSRNIHVIHVSHSFIILDDLFK